MVVQASGVNAAIQGLSNGLMSIFNLVQHQNPTASIYQGSTDRYTQSAQAYTIAEFATPGTLGQAHMAWEFQRVADLGGQTFLLMGLPGLANVVNMAGASSEEAVCEIVHPDILEHYRAALSPANKGRVVSEADPSFRFMAYDGPAIDSAASTFQHAYEGQPYWTPNVGYFAQNAASAAIGNATIDTHHGLRSAAWAEVNGAPGKRMGAMVGGSDLGSIRLNKHLEFKRRSMRYQLLCVPLLFSYCLDPSSYLPLPAMQFHKVDLTFSLRSASQLICNGSNCEGNNSMALASKVSAWSTSIAGPVGACNPFTALEVLTADPVYTIKRYAETAAGNLTSKGDMVALVDNAGYSFATAAVGSDASLAALTYQCKSADCPVLIGARLSFLQGAERGSMIQGGYDIPMVVSQSQQHPYTVSGSNSVEAKVDISSFTNSIEALYVVSQSSNALGANHYNAGRTWDPLTEEYTNVATAMSVTINGADSFTSAHPAFFNKLLTYINANCVPTGDSHVYFVPFAMTVNGVESVSVTGSQQAASRWSNAKVTLTLPALTATSVATNFSGATGSKNQRVIVYADTYNSLHVGQGVAGNVMSSTQPPTQGYVA